MSSLSGNEKKADYVLKPKTIPLDDSWDVIVVGGGPAGCAAAAASAREGAKTLLIEATGVLGGMGTAGLVPWFCGYDDGEKVIARGLAEHVRLSLQRNMKFVYEARKDLPKNAPDSPAIDPELLKRIYDDMVTGAGSSILFHTKLASVDMKDDSSVDAIIAANKSGLVAFRAKVYVDATGDGDLAAWAGAVVEKGGENGALQPGTMCFMIANIDEERLAVGPSIHCYDPDSPIWKIIRDDKYPDIIDLHSCFRKIGPGVYGLNTGHVFDVDNTDPENLSQSILLGRRMAGQYRDAFAEYHPAFADCFLAATGSLLGIRETRRIIGEAYLTVDDYLAARSFPDEICRTAYGLDVHGTKAGAIQAAKMTIDELKKLNQEIVCNLKPGTSMGVPYRCLTPKGLRNVLAAGRCISTDRRVNGTVRIMACCLNTGEAAGIAAAMAAKDTGDVHAVDVKKLRSTLKAHGAYLPDPA
ncbi:MAG: FAD-dependent oxidoreductase [Clostridiales bacterium]|nr:FAD-dependent oxidoreductase [Clostridiales bacterium]